MSRRAIAVLAAIVALGSAFSSSVGQPGNGGVRQFEGLSNDERSTFDLWTGWTQSGRDRPAIPTGSAVLVAQPAPKFTTSLICFDGRGDETPAPEGGWCESGIPQTGALDCESDLVPPTWRRLEYPDGTATSWERLDEGSCVPVIPVLTVEDFRSLPIPPPVLTLQPDQDWVLVNIATIVMTDPTPVPMRTALAGYGVDVEAVPVRFTYDFGDGHDLVTRSAGYPYPDHDTFHEYETPGTYVITLTTEWSGRYRVGGDPTWREVTGTETTSVTSAPFEAQERTSRLVSGLCTDRPKPPDC